MNTDELIQAWEQEERQLFLGWDFSHLDGRMLEDEPPWSYPARAGELMQRASSVLDMGTGGGERILELLEHWPRKVVATEEYPPNLRLATARLAPFGAQVVRLPLTETGLMPFEDGEFDLVLNRHSGLNVNEVARILAPGGTFLTQQVHGMSANDLMVVFGTQPQWPDSTPQKYVPQLQAAGLTVADAREWSGRLSFTDVGAIVYYLKAVPWLVPDFSVDKYTRQLLILQQRLESGQGLSFSAGKYLIEAHKGEYNDR
jgi:SAM-dependent methyltransferase